MDKLSVLNWQGQDLQIRDKNSYPRTVRAAVFGSDLIETNDNILNELTNAGIAVGMYTDAGMGFSMVGANDGETFAQKVNALTEDDGYTDLVVLAGDRDYLNLTYLATNIRAFITNARTNMPDVRIHFGFIPWTLETGSIYDDLISEYKIILAQAYGYNVNVIPFEGLSHSIENLPPSGVGMGSTDLDTYGKYLARYLIYGTYTSLNTTISHALTNDSNITGVLTTYSSIDLYAKRVRLFTATKLTAALTVPQSVTCDGTSEITLGTLDAGWAYGRNSTEGEELSTTCSIVLSSSTAKVACVASLWITAGVIKLVPFAYGAGTTPVTMNVSSIEILQFHAEGDLMYN